MHRGAFVAAFVAGSLGGVRPAEAQVDMRGRVLDAVAGTPIGNASVRVTPPDRATLTSEAGDFLLGGIPEGFVEVAVEAAGYATMRLTIDPSRTAQPLFLYLEPAPFSLEGLDVEVTETTTLNGRVVDARSGAGLSGATVRPVGGRRSARVLADRDGHFSVDEVRAGVVLIEVRHLGYVPEVRSVATPTSGDVLVSLQPDSVAMRRVADFELKARAQRRAIATMPVRTLDRDRVASRPWTETRDLLRFLGIEMEPCPIDLTFPGCRRVGTRLLRVDLCIDGRIGFGGIAELDSYDPEDIHLIESFGRGSILRVTTVAFLERVATMERPPPTTCRDPTIR